MIEALKDYVISIVCAALICGFVNTLIKPKGSVGTIIKLLSGIFLTLCVISPLINLDFSDAIDYVDVFSFQADYSVSEGASMVNESLRQSIKKQTETYILDKAASMKAELTVEVTLSEDSPPVPMKVILKGNISPSAKSRLTQIIETDLAIPEEHQLWT